MLAHITVPLRPTEDQAKVMTSVGNIFPGTTLFPEVGSLKGSTEDLDRFLGLLRDQRIRDTALSIFRASMVGDVTVFHLNKQAAFAGKVNFTDGSSTLGDILVEVQGANLLMERTAPSPDSPVQHRLNTFETHGDGDGQACDDTLDPCSDPPNDITCHSIPPSRDNRRDRYRPHDRE